MDISKALINIKAVFILKRSKRKIFRQRNLLKLRCKRIPANISPSVTVGKNFTIGRFSYINAHSNVGHNTKIGAFCSIAKFVEIAPHAHPINWLSTHTFQYQPNKFPFYPGYKDNSFLSIKTLDTETIIGNDVWIGTNAIILKGVNVGTGAVIGAGTIVTKDVPPYSVVVGVPGKVIKYRFDSSTIDKLLSSKWWERNLRSLQHLSYDDINLALDELNNKV